MPRYKAWFVFSQAAPFVGRTHPSWVIPASSDKLLRVDPKVDRIDMLGSFFRQIHPTYDKKMWFHNLIQCKCKKLCLGIGVVTRSRNDICTCQSLDISPQVLCFYMFVVFFVRAPICTCFCILYFRARACMYLLCI